MVMKKKLIFAAILVFATASAAAWAFFTGRNREPVVIKEDRTEQFEGEKDNLEKEQEEKNIEEENLSEEAQEGSTPDVSKESNAPEAKPENNSQEAKETPEADFKIKNQLFSWGYEKATNRKIDTIILHSTYNATGGDEFDLEKIIGIYKSYGVAPHYIVARDGKVYRTVSDKNIAYHAGESKTPDGRTGVNNFSIGIEIINSKTQGPTETQYSSLKKLVSHLKGEYKIKYVLGHKDIAPERKDDPWKFDFGKIK